MLANSPLLTLGARPAHSSSIKLFSSFREANPPGLWPRIRTDTPFVNVVPFVIPVFPISPLSQVHPLLCWSTLCACVYFCILFFRRSSLIDCPCPVAPNCTFLLFSGLCQFRFLYRLSSWVFVILIRVLQRCHCNSTSGFVLVNGLGVSSEEPQPGMHCGSERTGYIQLTCLSELSTSHCHTLPSNPELTKRANALSYARFSTPPTKRSLGHMGGQGCVGQTALSTDLLWHQIFGQ